MQFGQIELPVYQSQVIARDYLLSGGFQPIGPMLPFLNDAGRRFIQFKDATLNALDADNPLAKLQPSAVMLNKDDIVAVSILDPAGFEAAQLFATKHKVIVYSDRFVIKGDLHMGADDQPLDILSSSNHDFMGMTGTTLYPLKASRSTPRPNAQLMLIHRKNILFYHLADAG